MRRVLPLAVAAAALAFPVAPATAVTPYGPWTAPTTGSSGAFRVDATCVFGPMIVGEPPQLYVTGWATAPGALLTTVECSHAGPETSVGSLSAYTERVLWDSPGALCVDASATFPDGTVVTAPTVCVDPSAAAADAATELPPTPLLPNGPLPWTVSTRGTGGAFAVEATCAFGPIVFPGRPESFDLAGAAVAPGALSTTVRCYARSSDGHEATLPGPAAAVRAHELWESIDAFCVSAQATFATGTVVAPKTCVTP